MMKLHLIYSNGYETDVLVPLTIELNAVNNVFGYDYGWTTVIAVEIVRVIP